MSRRDARFTALQSGEIDVLVRNTTWTASRDGIEGVTFLHPTFYDGQGMMVAADSGITSIDDMDGAVVCVVAGTTTEGNVATEFERRGLAVDVQSFPDVETAPGGFDRRWMRRLVERHQPARRLPLRVSGGARGAGDPRRHLLEGAAGSGGRRRRHARWAQAVNWAIFATIQAEEFGITGENVADMQANSEDPNIRQFLGGENADGTVLDPGLGLAPDFALQRRRPGRQLRRDLRAQPRPDSASSAASTPCGSTAVCSTPRRTAEH